MTQMDFFNPGETLNAERQRLIKERERGTHCGACGQFVKVYKRPIHSTLALSLFRLRWAGEPGEWVHITDVAAKMPRVTLNGDFGKLALWGFSEQKPKDPDKHIAGRTTGLWRITANGMEFLKGNTRAPRHCFTYNDTVLGWSEETVHITDCLKNKFDYDRLMAGEL